MTIITCDQIRAGQLVLFQSHPTAVPVTLYNFSALKRQKTTIFQTYVRDSFSTEKFGDCTLAIHVHGFVNFLAFLTT
jgi:hypothetical protein